MSEKRDFQTMKVHLKKPNIRIDRVESMVIAGVPDVNYCIDGIEGWIEMKSPKEPKRFTSKLFSDNHKLSQDQMNWFLRQRKVYGIGWVLICTDQRWMLIDGCIHGDDINGMTVVELMKISTWMTAKPVQKESWNELTLALSMKAKYIPLIKKVNNE